MSDWVAGIIVILSTLCGLGGWIKHRIDEEREAVRYNKVLRDCKRQQAIQDTDAWASNGEWK